MTTVNFDARNDVPQRERINDEAIGQDSLQRQKPEPSAGRQLVVRRQDLVPQRERVLDRASHMLMPLTRYIRNEIRDWSEHEKIEQHMLEPDDILMEVLVEAGEQMAGEQGQHGIFPRLREIARRTIRDRVDAESVRASAERSLDSPVLIAGTDWPDRVTVLRDTLEDPSAVLPESIVEQSETWALLEHSLSYLPERWREIFLLRHVDGWDDDEIANAEGVDAAEVEMISTAARAFLLECLSEGELITTS
jgi:RNA polymerase sigma factor (sigma-70 family)